jgi:hypothetical protein
MQESSKLSLSAFEQQLVTDASWILTKNRIIEKVYLLFGNLSEQYKQEPLIQQLPMETLLASPKIAKGENYEGLPYVMLDYPRCFGKEDTLAIRTFFWWGNFFSITLHLSGQYKKMLEKKIITALPVLKENGFYYCGNDEPWEHHFQENNYQPATVLNEADFEKAVRSRSFIKLAKKIPLEKWDEADTMLLAYFKEISNIIAD